MDKSATQKILGDFLTQTFLFEFDGVVDADTDLFEAGLVDSYGFIELVGFIEETFAVALDDDDLASPSIATLNGITELVATRSSGEAEPALPSET